MTYSIDPRTAPTAQNKNIQRKNIEEALLRLPWVSPTLGWPFWRDPSDLFHAKIWELTQKHCQKHSCQKSYRHCFTQHLFLYQQHVNTVRTLNRYHHDPESYQSNLQSTSELQIEAMIWLKCDNNEIFPLCLTKFRGKILFKKDAVPLQCLLYLQRFRLMCQIVLVPKSERVEENRQAAIQFPGSPPFPPRGSPLTNTTRILASSRSWCTARRL